MRITKRIVRQGEDRATISHKHQTCQASQPHRVHAPQASSQLQHPKPATTTRPASKNSQSTKTPTKWRTGEQKTKQKQKQWRIEKLIYWIQLEYHHRPRLHRRLLGRGLVCQSQGRQPNVCLISRFPCSRIASGFEICKWLRWRGGVGGEAKELYLFPVASPPDRSPHPTK